MQQELLDYDDLSSWLKLPKGTLYWMVNQGLLPCFRLGPRTVRFRRSEIEAWLSEKSEGVRHVEG